jgi:hypothetical protein
MQVLNVKYPYSKHLYHVRLTRKGDTEMTLYLRIVLIVGIGGIFFIVNVKYAFELQVSTGKQL